MTAHPLFPRRHVLDRAIARSIRDGTRIALFLDFDGTLTPIRESPSLVHVDPRMEQLLRRLLRRKDIALAIATGRSEVDLRRTLHVGGIPLISNHGFRFSSGKSQWVHPAAERYKALMRTVAGKLTHALALIHEALIENKGYTLTVNFRSVPAKSVPTVRLAVAEAVENHRDTLRITRGKKVLEVRPNVAWGKGHAVLRHLRSVNRSHTALVVYIGDDQTDEDAFRLLPAPAITGVVGRQRKTAARYWLRSTAEVEEFLRRIEQIRLGELTE